MLGNNTSLFSDRKRSFMTNSQFTDEIAEAIVRSPRLNSIKVLDISMGTLTDAGAEALLSPAINNLDILNVSENFLSAEMIQRLSQLEVQLFAERQKIEDDYSYIHSRYCSVTE